MTTVKDVTTLIDKMFSDTSVGQLVTQDRLETVIDHCDSLLSTLDLDDDDEWDSWLEDDDDDDLDDEDD